MFDSHCHLQNRELDDERPGLVARARAAGVSGLLLAGVDAEDWALQDRVAAELPDFAARCYGLHPQVVAMISDEETAAELRALEQALARRPSAIGEIGLDGQGERAAHLPRQEAAFRAQLAIARDGDLPIVLHILEAHGRAMEILRGDELPRAGGVVHSCSASAELVRGYVALGLSVSFAGAVANPRARRIREAARAVPIERLLVETDAPFQTPLAHRPARNEPAFLPTVVAALAEVRGEDPAALARRTEENARALFRFGAARS